MSLPPSMRSGALRRAAPLLVVAAVLAACATTAREPNAPTLRVMTYNIFAGNDLERQSNLARVAALIDSLRADVVLLQEVDRHTARSGGVDQAAVLAERTGMRALFGRAMDFDGGEYGIAVLSRWPVREWRVMPLDSATQEEPTSPPTEPRALLHAVLDSPGGAVHVLATHLDHRPQSSARRSQLLRLLAYMAEHVPRHAAVVFGGDLNAQPDATEVRALGIAFTDAWVACGAGDGNTFRTDTPTRRIDYIFFRGMQCTMARVLDRPLSDHLPVVVDLRAGPGTQRIP